MKRTAAAICLLLMLTASQRSHSTDKPAAEYLGPREPIERVQLMTAVPDFFNAHHHTPLSAQFFHAGKFMPIRHRSGATRAAIGVLQLTHSAGKLQNRAAIALIDDDQPPRVHACQLIEID